MRNLQETARPAAAIAALLSLGTAGCDRTAFAEGEALFITGPSVTHTVTEGGTLLELSRRLQVANWEELRGRLTYPDELRRAGQPRWVSIRLHVDDAGDVADLSIQRSSGSPTVDRAAADYAEQMRFSWLEDPEPGGLWVDSVTVAWPLIVVDGEPRPDLWPLSLLTAAVVDIQRVEVLKNVRRWAPDRYGSWVHSAVEVTTAASDDS